MPAALFWTLTLGAALAQDSVESVPEPNEAEYRRLSMELQSLAQRNAWAGVERAWQKLRATGVEPRFEDLLTAAHSARAMGDVAGVRDRLILAADLRPIREVVEWKWEIEQTYGRVSLACDAKGKKRPTLDREVMPFDPNQARAVVYAQEQIATDCLFIGMLPGGEYEFGDKTLVVHPRLESVTVDLRKRN